MRQLNLVAVFVKESFVRAIENSKGQMNQLVPCFLGSEKHQDQVIYLVNQFLNDWGGLNKYGKWSQNSNELRERMQDLQNKLQRNMQSAVMLSGASVIPQGIYLGSTKHVKELSEIPKMIGQMSAALSERKIKDSNYRISR